MSAVDSHGETLASRPPVASNFVPSLGNFSIQYNLTSASIAIAVLSDRHYLGHPLREEPEWASDMSLGIAFVGAMVGMACMGRLGDVLGRARAMRVTLGLTLLGAITPALAFGRADAVYGIICGGRLILGVGVGGLYPLSAVSSAEGAGDALGRGSRVGQAFFWQVPGVVAPYLVSALLLPLLRPARPAAWVPEVQFRLLFALGALPALAVLVASWRDEGVPEDRCSARRAPAPGLFEAVRGEPWQTWRTLAGTAGSWLVYDVVYYGTLMFTPQILEDICLVGTRRSGSGCRQTLSDTSLESVIVSLMGIPGAAMAILLIGRLGCRRLNSVGFLLLSLNFAALAAVLGAARHRTSVLFALYCSLNFGLQFGPNVGTFVLPAVCFPRHIRSTCHGLSATGGKLGAVIGTFMFPLIKRSSIGLAGVLWVEAALCIVGMLLSHVFLKDDWDYLRELDDRVAAESFVHWGAPPQPE